MSFMNNDRTLQNREKWHNILEYFCLYIFLYEFKAESDIKIPIKIGIDQYNYLHFKKIDFKKRKKIETQALKFTPSIHCQPVTKSAS